MRVCKSAIPNLDGKKKELPTNGSTGTAPSERRDPRAVHKSPAPRRTNQFASCTGTALPKRRDPARGPSTGTAPSERRDQQRASRLFTSLPPVRSEAPSAQNQQGKTITLFATGELYGDRSPRATRPYSRGSIADPQESPPPQQRASRRYLLPPGEALLVCRAEALTRAVQDRLVCAELSAGLAAGRAVFHVAGSAPLFPGC
ncbi:hypothetical protein NDU88_006294 [Pleurodeles waltl]|uniref:Uncharacterized protein n=1 Tax=Pleurodeles waltl TaxID=8319 RepID=A0AAV7NU00_PLEWA|nr:hypothetical protein NDU88_006294 [Pleurodeles waltl]